MGAFGFRQSVSHSLYPNLGLPPNTRSAALFVLTD